MITSIVSFSFHLIPKKDDPFLMMKKQHDGTVTYEGYCIDLFKELAKKLHFTYDIYPSPDGLYGAETENGTWNGLIAELINKVCELLYQTRGRVFHPISKHREVYIS